jgi:GNAT superfamily N-acetyltransferase
MDWLTLPQAGLDIAMSNEAGGPVLELFYSGYDRAFVLPNEKENFAGFVDCLNLNHGAARKRLDAMYGPFSEVCLVARDSESLEFVGGSNFIALSITARDRSIVTANLNYIFVDSAARGRGYFGRLVEAVRQAAIIAMGSSGEPVIFIEQNDPLRMSLDDYQQDTEFTGLDQLDRMRIWAKQNARVIDHPYTQPPLTRDAEPDDNLIYGVLSDQATLDACLLRDHLRAFFGISVLKGRPLADEPIAARQIATLDDMCVAGQCIDLLDPAEFLAQIETRSSAEAEFHPFPESTRAAIKRMKPLHQSQASR